MNVLKNKRSKKKRNQKDGSVSIEDHVISVLTSDSNRRYFKDSVKSSKHPRDFDRHILLSAENVVELIDKSLEIIKEQPMLLELAPAVHICGDIHGQFTDLLWLFDCANYPPDANYLFLGDFVDRGRNSLEVASLFMAYKIKYPNRFFFLRGNHESNPVNEHYSFKVECETRLLDHGRYVWNKFGELFTWLPAAAVVGGKIFCTHGGLSPSLKYLDSIKRIQRPVEVPTSGLLCDLVWADPDNNPSGWRYNEARAISYKFGTDIIKAFLERNKLVLIVRAHELVRKGYEIIANKQLVTIFSAPNYTGVFGNNGALLMIDEDLECTIITLDFKTKKEKQVHQCVHKHNLFHQH